MQANKLPTVFLMQVILVFYGLRNTLDHSASVSVTDKKDIGVSKSHAAAISSEDQKLMWESGASKSFFSRDRCKRLSTASKGVVPANTESTNKWALRDLVGMEWKSAV